jgi:CRISPR-associated protein Csy1
MEQASEVTWRQAIHGFIQERLRSKVDALEKDKKLDEAAKKAKHSELLSDHQPRAWLDDAAVRVKQIQLATHTLKPIHPDAKGSQIFAKANPKTPQALVGLHALAALEETLDVVGNAAALDVFKLLKLKPTEQAVTLLEALQQRSPDAMAALSDDASVAQQLADSLLSVLHSKGDLASHTLGKQLYFPTTQGDHLLAPLYPTQLAHAVHEHLQTSRFSDDVKAARDARRDNLMGGSHRDYPNLLTQSFGGTKPQNISQLNSERGGRTHLFANLPPNSTAEFSGPPFGQVSVFDRNGAFVRRSAVKDKLRELRAYLDASRTVRSDKPMREFRAEAVQDIVDELLDFAAQLHRLPAGWSDDSRCQLRAHQKYWLDPRAERTNLGQSVQVDDEFDPFGEDDGVAVQDASSDWPRMVARDFADWFNSALSTKKNVLQDEEHQNWWRDVKRILQRMQKELADV